MSGWFSADDQFLARLVIWRGIGLVYVIAFVVALDQFRPLLGERGLQPVRSFVAAVPFRRAPSLFHWRYSDRMLTGVGGVGLVLSGCVTVGLVERLPLALSMSVWLILWALYLSIVNVGQTFYGFGWETLLLEAGFLAILLGNGSTAPPVVVLWLFRWLAFRVEFGAGLIKMRGDPCWRDLTCLYYHHETQPLPNPLSWRFHHLPKRMHRAEVLGNHVAQLVLPFALFLPQPVSGIAAALIIVTQLWLMLSGNFAWLNLLTIVIVGSALPDSMLRHLLPAPHHGRGASTWFGVVVLAIALGLVILSYRPARNLVSKRQAMNASFDALRLVNAYGAFGHITKERNELIIEGTSDERIGDDTVWRAYELRAKPGDPRRRPRQIAPYHLRLDWLMWFAAMGSPHASRWLRPLLLRLLEDDRATFRLFRTNPFADAPPTYVRVEAYRYRFSDRATRRRTGEWWTRTHLGTYLAPVRLRQTTP
ncbi:MAG: hypothetical protein JWN62_2631 [Acidimicrobiales bacterium]|nr:hypothetical protein [Acidimicrobiales bacterium]